MLLSKSNQQVAAKLLLAAVLLGLLAAVAGSKLAPTVSIYSILLYCALGAIAVFVLLAIAAAMMMAFNQFILRHGGTDTQWFWFSSEPAGLVKLRAQSRNAQDNFSK
jgi:predicted membrane channel-forming protein YqfA (hemolysin III family)